MSAGPDDPGATVNHGASTVFICYSRRDESDVGREVAWLSDQGLTVWQDTQMRGGVEWPDAIRRAIDGCQTVLFFVTPASVESQFCLRELVYAQSHGKPILAYHLVQTTLLGGLELMLADRQAIFAYQYAKAMARDRLLQALSESSGERDPPAPAARSDLRAEEVLRMDVAHSPSARAVANDICRYLSMHRGMVRPRIVDGDAHAGDSTYRLSISIDATESDIELSWRLDEQRHADILASDALFEPADTFQRKRARLAETIGECALRAIAEHQWSDAHARSIDTMGYAQLVLSADQLNYLDIERITERIRRLREAIRIAPLRPQAYAALAALFAWARINRLGAQIAYDAQEVEALVGNARKYGPNDPYVLASLGTTHCRLGRHSGGISLLRRALALAPCAGTKDQLARSLCFVGEPEAAVRLFEEILDALPAGQMFPHVRLAVAQTLCGRMAEALESAQLATTHYPDDYFGWLVLANALSLSNDLDGSSQAIATAQSLSPHWNLEKLLDNMRETYRANGDRVAWLCSGLEKVRTRIAPLVPTQTIRRSNE